MGKRTQDSARARDLNIVSLALKDDPQDASEGSTEQVRRVGMRCSPTSEHSLVRRIEIDLPDQDDLADLDLERFCI